MLPLTLEAWLSACTTWSVRSGPVESVAAEKKLVRVSQTDSSTYVLWEPRVELDSLIGYLGKDREGRVMIAVAVGFPVCGHRHGVPVAFRFECLVLTPPLRARIPHPPATR